MCKMTVTNINAFKSKYVNYCIYVAKNILRFNRNCATLLRVKGAYAMPSVFELLKR